MPHTLLTVPILALFVLLYPIAVLAAGKDLPTHRLDHRGGSSSTIMTVDHTDTASTLAVIPIVFSDIDGTILHYPDEKSSCAVEQEPGNRLLELPPSSTGMVGVLSSRTLVQCRELRRLGVKFVLISGMRSSTLMKRLPFLPKADAYCCEAGGRIFVPSSSGYKVTPVRFDGADEEDLKPFFLREDMEWRSGMEEITAAGKDGFVGINHNDQQEETEIPLSIRQGALWQHASLLMEQGLVLDTKGYATCFRVNRKQQTSESLFELFLMKHAVACPPEFSSSTNLGCVDVYPSGSGKLNW
jgi:hypothetical protein